MKLALQIGYKIKLVRGYVFRAGPVLRSFRNSLSTLKQKAEDRKDEPTRTAIKLVTNRINGKFGATYFLNATLIVDDDEIDILERLYKVRSVIPVTEDLRAVKDGVEPKKDSEASKDLLKWDYHKASNQLTGKDTNIAIAAAITRHGRIILNRMIIDVLKQGGEILYVDTDRIFVYIADNPQGKALRKFTWPQRDKKNQFVNDLFIAPKIYYYEDLNGNKAFKSLNKT